MYPVLLHDHPAAQLLQLHSIEVAHTQDQPTGEVAGQLGETAIAASGVGHDGQIMCSLKGPRA